MKAVITAWFCLTFAAPALAGDGDSFHCEPCLDVDSSISPTPAFQTVAGSTAGQPNAEYSYSFCAVGDATYEFLTCPDLGPGSATFDTAISVQPDGCGPFHACNDDQPNCSQIFRSYLSWTAPANGTYVVVVDGFKGDTGDYVLAYRGAACEATPVEPVSWGMLKAIYE